MVWQQDPLLRPRCGSAMRIISFITDRPVIDKILRHIGFTFSSTSAPQYHRPRNRAHRPWGEFTDRSHGKVLPPTAVGHMRPDSA